MNALLLGELSAYAIIGAGLLLLLVPIGRWAGAGEGAVVRLRAVAMLGATTLIVAGGALALLVNEVIELRGALRHEVQVAAARDEQARRLAQGWETRLDHLQRRMTAERKDLLSQFSRVVDQTSMSHCWPRRGTDRVWSPSKASSATRDASDTWAPTHARSC